jgi:tetratricopeptide (TPR) repeat protein
MAPKLSRLAKGALERAEMAYFEACDELEAAEDEAGAYALKPVFLGLIGISPLLSAGYVALAEVFADDETEELQYWRCAVSAAELVLGEEFQALKGEFWGFLETRPYMIAKEGLADCLMRVGMVEDAIVHYAEMLELNPTDNQGVREILIDQLVRLKRLDEAEAVLARYPDDWSAWMGWSGLLLSYLRHGASEDTVALLAEANLNNPHILPMLTGAKRIPKAEPEMYSPGSKEEAVIYARQGVTTWRLFPEALDWLKTIPKSAS